MPEGDTIHKLAAALAPRLIGHVPSRIELKATNAAQLSALRIQSVAARGKHLIIEFEQGRLLRTHLGMHGAWHRYGLTEAWKKPVWQASVIMAIAQDVYVCFNAKECEIVRTDGVRDRSLNMRLRLDLLAPDADLHAAPVRARDMLEADTPIADVLLDQRIACGIGNVYKSEVLFLRRIHPLTPLGTVSDGRLLDIYATAADLLRRNLPPGPRVTRFANDAAGGVWVYRRTGLPCLACGTAVSYARCGKNWRGTYWCPCCQPRHPTRDAAQGVDQVPR